jgi:hypothetical protein
MEQARTNGETAASCHAQGGGDLEPYRLLVDAQRQVVELTRQCEQIKRECERLREQVATGPGVPADKSSTRQKVIRASARVFRAMERGVTIRHKNPRNPELL